MGGSLQPLGADEGQPAQQGRYRCCHADKSLSGHPLWKTDSTAPSCGIQMKNTRDSGKVAISSFKPRRRLPSTDNNKANHGTAPSTKATPTHSGYVAIGGAVTVTMARSRVAYEIDLAAERDDHWVAEVAARGTIGGATGRGHLWKPRYDRAKMLTRDILRRAYEQYQPLPWWTNVDEQYEHLRKYLVGTLCEHFLLPKDGPRTTYIPEEAWEWRKNKMLMKQRTRHRKTLWSDLWRTWCTGEPLQGAELERDTIFYQCNQLCYLPNQADHLQG